MAFIYEVPTIFIQRFYTGWITLRNQLVTPIKTMGRRIIELYDALIAGNDWEVTPKLSLKRRAGHTGYVIINFPALTMVSWKSNTQGTIPVVDTTGDIEYVNGGGTATTLVSKPTSVQTGMLGIGNFFYMGNVGPRNLKWDGPAGVQGVSNWGIAIGSVNNASGPNTAGIGINSGTGVAWTNPNNVTSAINYATVSLSLFNQGSMFDQGTQFGFSVGASNVIVGIMLQFDYISTDPSGQSNFVIGMLKSGAQIGINKTVTPSTINPTTVTLGSTSDLWGATWTASDINNAAFGVQISARTNGPSVNFSIKNVNITVYGLGGPNVTVSALAGTFSAVNGYQYVFAYGSSASGEVSNATPISANTVAFSNKLNVAVSLTASTDAQVNQIRVYRTTDSGGGNLFFELPNSPFPNASATIQDTAADTALQVTSQAEINLGNTTPPTGLINLEWFAGRMWGSVNNLLYASTGPETLSGTAPQSNWNPAFQWVIPGPIIKLTPGPNGMLIRTLDDSYIVRGTDITNFTVNEFVKDFGLRSFNAEDTDGTNIYTLTSDRQFVLVSASGAEDIGLPIADQLENVDPTTAYVTVNRYGLDSIVRILDTAAGVFYDFNLNQQCWNLPGILQMPAVSAAGSIETSPGVWRLLLSSSTDTTTTLAFRDVTNFQDLGANYQPNAVFGSIQLADPGSLAKFGARGGIVLETTNAGSPPYISVLPNDIGCDLTQAIGSQIIPGAFTSLSVGSNPVPWPPTLSNQPKNYRSLGWYWLLAKGLSGLVRHIQVQVSAKPENAATELIGFGIFGDEKSEGQGKLPEVQGR